MRKGALDTGEPMHVHSDTGGSAVQEALPQLAQLEATCSRILREWPKRGAKIDELEKRVRIITVALDEEARQRRRAQLLQSAAELKLEQVHEQLEEGRRLLQLIVDAWRAPLAHDREVLLDSRAAQCAQFLATVNRGGSC